MTQDVSAPAQPGALTRRAVPAVVVVAGAAAGFAVGKGHDESGSGPGANAGGAGGGGGSAQLATLDQVPAGGGLVLDGQGIVLTRDNAGNVHGFSAVCTHQGCSVSDVTDGTINCPCHGSKFDASTGAPVAGPAGSPLPPVDVTVRDNAIFAGQGDQGGAAAGGGDAGGGTQLASLAEIPAGGGVILDKAGIVLTRDDAGNVHGFSATCTHQGCTVAEVANGTINCPCHGSKFDAATGAPVAGPAGSPLPPVNVTVRDNAVFAS